MTTAGGTRPATWHGWWPGRDERGKRRYHPHLRLPRPQSRGTGRRAAERGRGSGRSAMEQGSPHVAGSPACPARRRRMAGRLADVPRLVQGAVDGVRQAALELVAAVEGAVDGLASAASNRSITVGAVLSAT